MKQILTTLLVLVSIAGLSQTDFRNSNWGDSPEKVRQSETTAIFRAKSDDAILYFANLARFDTSLGYVFAGNKLVRSNYVIKEKHSNTNEYISDYEELKGLLIKKYGEPAEDEIFWFNNLYKGDNENYGLAVSIGHLAYFAKWDVENTEIAILLNGDNYKISCMIEYTGVEFKEYESKIKDKAVLSDF
jgi:hypothetical protein